MQGKVVEKIVERPAPPVEVEVITPTEKTNGNMYKDPEVRKVPDLKIPSEPAPVVKKKKGILGWIIAAGVALITGALLLLTKKKDNGQPGGAPATHDNPGRPGGSPPTGG